MKHFLYYNLFNAMVFFFYHLLFMFFILIYLNSADLGAPTNLVVIFFPWRC